MSAEPGADARLRACLGGWPRRPAHDLVRATAAEPLQPQDLVITLLGTYVRPVRGDRVWSGGLVALLGELGFSHGAARVALTRLVRRGLIARERPGGSSTTG